MIRLQENGINGILADEMGLGDYKENATMHISYLPLLLLYSSSVKFLFDTTC